MAGWNCGLTGPPAPLPLFVPRPRPRPRLVPWAVSVEDGGGGGGASKIHSPLIEADRVRAWTRTFQLDKTELLVLASAWRRHFFGRLPVFRCNR